MLGPEVLDVGHQRHRLIPLVGLALDSGAFKAADPGLVEDGIHRDDALEFASDGGEVGLIEHAAGAGGFEGIG